MNQAQHQRWVRFVRGFIVVLSLALVLLTLPAYFESPTPAPAVRTSDPTPEPTFETADIRLTRIVKLYEPTALAVRPGDDNLYIAQKGGRVFAVRKGRAKMVVDIRDEVTNKGEQGLLGLTFTPDGRRMVIYFVDLNEDIRVRTYAFNGRIAPHGGKQLLFVDHPDTNFHYGGNVAFGPDGHLYVSLGDGGFPRDTPNNAQSLDRLLGKILRVDVQPDGTLGIPPDNPFVGDDGASDEIWAYGLRNPWRFSFDAKSGDLWIADVGMTLREEVNVEPAGSTGGRNYGWNRIEGNNVLKGPALPDAIAPVYEYEHRDGVCAVIGGYVYRGFRMRGLRGAYLFADICRGRIEALELSEGKVVGHRTMKLHLEQMASFGQDAAGELYVLSLTKGVFRIDPA